MSEEMPAFDLYAELEVSERASVETIQAAYRSLQLRNHPDRVGLDAGERAVRLNVARDWLLDPVRRARYDAGLAAARREAEERQRAAAADAAVVDDVDDDGGLAARDDDGLETPTPGAEDEASTQLAATHINLRVDVGRFVRIWLVGLATLGGLAITPAVAWPATVRVAVAVACVLVLLGLTGRRLHRDPDAGLRDRAAGTAWSAIGWAGLALLAAAGGAAVGAAASRSGAGSGLTDVVGPVLGGVAAVSLTAVRRRLGPVRATVDDFLAMTPTEFETAVGQVLGRHGYRLRRTGGPGDLVADLAGTDPDGRPAVVQCKRYAPGHPVGSRDVQLLIAMGMRHHKAERLVLVTTSDFTDPAIDLAETHGVALIAGRELEDLTR